ncbi:helix-turn-helix transcriptional regulator [Stigmatella hybrida]|uniref:helix-turn-helix transcriptional regulator n=1 Tax=Stigmatella hybrida TaxID=394097 RepID=UPI001CDB2B26|nr:helix-turn-helix transcriptional regulator [Stigmatella hybrida]
MKGKKFRAGARVSQRPRHRKRPGLSHHVKRREQRLAVTLGEAASLARREAGLTQQDVAESIGIVPEVYGRIERGGSLPSITTLFRLCVTLYRGPNELMGFVPLRGLPPRSSWAREISPALAETPEMRRLLRLIGYLPRLQLKLMARVAASLLRDERRQVPEKNPG